MDRKDEQKVLDALFAKPVLTQALLSDVNLWVGLVLDTEMPCVPAALIYEAANGERWYRAFRYPERAVYAFETLLRLYDVAERKENESIYQRQ